MVIWCLPGANEPRPCFTVSCFGRKLIMRLQSVCLPAACSVQRFHVQSCRIKILDFWLMPVDVQREYVLY